MPRIDFGHFYKFVASTGIALLIASFAVPWLFSQSVAVFSIPSESIDGLTPTARAAVLQRQEALALTQSWIPALSIALLLAGIILLWWGLRYWKKRQQVLDSGEDLDLSTKKAAFESATLTEIEDKLQAEATAEDAVTEGDSTGRAHGPDDRSPEPAPSHSHVPSPTVRPARESMAARRELLRENENRARTLLVEAFSDEFSVNANVRLKTDGSDGAILDFLLDPLQDSGLPQLAIDLRIVSVRSVALSMPGVMARFAIATRTLKSAPAFLTRPGRAPSAGASGVMILLIEAGAFEKKYLDRAIESAAAVNSVLRRPVGTIFAPVDGFASITSDRLRAAVLDAWSGASTTPVPFVSTHPNGQPPLAATEM